MDQKVALPEGPVNPLTTKNFKENHNKLLGRHPRSRRRQAPQGHGARRQHEGLRQGDRRLQRRHDGRHRRSPCRKTRRGRSEPRPLSPRRQSPNRARPPTPSHQGFLARKGHGQGRHHEGLRHDAEAGARLRKRAKKRKRPARRRKGERRENAAAAKDAEMKDMVTKPAMDAGDQQRPSRPRRNRCGTTSAASVLRLRTSSPGPASCRPRWPSTLPPTFIARHASCASVEGAKTLHADALLPGAEVAAADRRQGSGESRRSVAGDGRLRDLEGDQAGARSRNISTNSDPSPLPFLKIRGFAPAEAESRR